MSDLSPEKNDAEKKLTVGIVGLGLIGGSFAKAYSEAGHTVLAKDVSDSALQFARADGAIAGELTKDNIADCDLILVAVYPEAAINFLKEYGPLIGEKPVVLDTSGVKRVVVYEAFDLAKEYGFTFVGGHPMAGTHNSGYKYARANLYHNAPMVLVPSEEDRDNILLLTRVKELLAPVGFGSYSVTTAENHDELIAFTSQLAHLVSNAYIKSPTAKVHRGFSAGSYKDMTRVARMNEVMWAELFLENKDDLLKELDILTENLDAYRRALVSDDREALQALLKEGSDRKKEVDG